MRFLVLGALLMATPSFAKPFYEVTCQDMFSDIVPEFDRDVALDTKNLIATYKGRSFFVPLSEAIMLQILLTAPNEIVSIDEMVFGLWGRQEPENPEVTIRVMMSHLRNRFKRIDPNFDKIESKHGNGIFWRRPQMQRQMKGRIGYAVNVYEGYVDEIAIPLSRGEHLILQKLLHRQKVGPHNVDISEKSFPVVLCYLNRKFKAHLGFRVAVSAGENGFIHLNPQLKSVVSEALEVQDGSINDDAA